MQTNHRASPLIAEYYADDIEATTGRTVSPQLPNIAPRD